MRTHSILSLSSLFFLLLLLVSSVTADESAVMSEFLKTLTPPPSGWSSGTAHCSWDGVTCDSTKTVTSINLKSLGLKGSLPSDLHSLTQLTTLSLQSNQLSGAIPSLANLSSLQEVYLDSNNFTSVAPGCFAGLTSLKTLSISNNVDLQAWNIPSELSESTNLANLYADGAGFVGSIPDFLGQLPNLQDLRLSYNNLTGSLPLAFGKSLIKRLWLNNQAVGLSGTIDVLSSMEFLYEVWLQKNQFTGPIPDLTKCTNLFDLQLRDNQFTGIVPDSLMLMPTLMNVSLDNNKLLGPMPSNPRNIKLTLGTTYKFCRSVPGPCDGQVNVLLAIAGALGYPAILADSWNGNDACASWASIACLSGKIVSVTFSKRNFSGAISPAFANLTSLRSLLLNDNQLTGPIPESLTALLQLETLDVSNNNLNGTVPPFRSGIKLVTTGNPLLGTNSTGGEAGGTPGSTNSTSGGSSGGQNGSSISPGILVGIVLAVLVFVGVVLFVLYKCYLNGRHQKFKRVGNPESGTEISKLGVLNGGNNGYGGLASELQSQSSGDHSDFHVFTGGNIAMPIQVLLQVTNNFSDENILGKGGFGIVYRGELQDGTKVAVKRMEAGAMGTKGLNEFQAEITVLSKVRHRHLVALLGYCINCSERLLVYEYMPQGTLTQHLFEWKERGCLPLTWKQRVTIALDVARGVEYLHSLAQQSFIHRDLKPSNILLGDDMRAKVADFGLVKNAPDGKYSVETRLAGTFGYLAPEYAATGRVTTKVDVYAFGVVLMELITGRKALDNTVPDESAHLVTWFRRILINRENIPKAIDRTLDPDEETMESIYKVAELAGHCTAREPYQRPDMGHAVNVLGPLVQQWKPSTQEEESTSTGNNMDLSDMLRQWQSGEGTSMMFDSMSYSNTQSSIPAHAFSNSVRSTDCR